MNGDHVLKAFETAWQAGKTPPLAEFLPPDVIDRELVLVELVHLDLEFRLKRGEAVRIEHYLAAYPDLAGQTEAVLDLLTAEFRLRSRYEPELRLDEYFRRFP